MMYDFAYLTSVYKGNNIILPYDSVLRRSDKVLMECPVHGNFYQAISSVLAGNGCQKCYFDSKRGKLKYTSKDWITSAEQVHNKFYSYSKSEFTGVGNKVTITCPVHGDFEQAANVHLNGHGCRKCSVDRMVKDRSYDTEKFKEVAISKHNGKYNYDNSIFTGIRDKVTITCPEHGDFEQIAYYHTYGNGCPTCGIEKTTYKSLPEFEIIEFIRSLGISNIKHGSRMLGFELDIFLPDKNIGIEYNGLYWHSSKSIETDILCATYHLSKTEECNNNGIRLFHVFENEWLDPVKKEIWKSVIRNALGLSKKIYARKCEIKELSNKVAIEFCDKNHLQGGVNSSIAYGLFFKDALVSVITAGNSRYLKNSTEILRFCNKLDTTVVGGFSKLLSSLEKRTNRSILSYANRRWSNGNLYTRTGFVLKNISGPCYFYLDKKFNIYHRSSFTKKNVLRQFPGSVGSEVSIMYENGYRRIWDCGNFVFIKERNEK